MSLHSSLSLNQPHLAFSFTVSVLLLPICFAQSFFHLSMSKTIIQRKLDETVPLLLSVIENLLSDDHPKQKVVDQQVVEKCKEIGEFLQSREYMFPDLKHFEEELLRKFTELEQVIEDVTYGGKVETIDGKFKEVKDFLSKIQLTYQKPVQKQEEEKSEGKTMSDEWLALGIEESILVSPAMATLETSYTILDIHLKMCLLCFAIFPEKAVIRKRPLIYWWIGEGFVRKTKEKSAEEAGEEAFQKLIDDGLIIPEQKKARVSKEASPVVDSCTMHPWIRRMVISVSKKAEFFDLDSRGAPICDSFQSRRICLVKNVDINERVSRQIQEEYEERPLLTLFNVDARSLSLDSAWFSKLDKVTVLQLGRWQNSAVHHIEVENQDFLNNLGDFTHLKYLSFQGISRITELPSSVFRLVHLEILDLRACHNLEKLPRDISSLINLTHLDLSECYLLESMPTGLNKLSSLQVLKGFWLETSTRSSGKIVDLSQLQKLRKLSIYMGSDDPTHVRELQNLKDIKSLRVLTITWKEVAKIEGKSYPKPEKEDATVRKGPDSSFSFPPNLEKLDLRCIPFKDQPAWLKPASIPGALKKLYIRGGQLQSLDSAESEKWRVEILRLKYLQGFKVKWILEKHFPDLKYYEKIKCYENSEVWIYDEDEKKLKSVPLVEVEEKKEGIEKESDVKEAREAVKQSEEEKEGIEKESDVEEVREAVKQSKEKKEGIEKESDVQEAREAVKQSKEKKEGTEKESAVKEAREAVKQSKEKKEGTEKESAVKEARQAVKQSNEKKEGIEKESDVKEAREAVKQSNEKGLNKAEEITSKNKENKEETKKRR